MNEGEFTISSFKFSIPHTVHLKYDDIHSDQKFSESELYPLIAWKRPLNAQETPTKHPRNKGVELNFRVFLFRMGVIIFETHCNFSSNLK